MLAIIVAYANHQVIGYQGKIPWDIPEDRQRYKELTTGHWIVMGRRTYEEIGHPLPNRETIVVSGTKCFDAKHCITVPSLSDAIRLVPPEQTLYVSGGEQLYREALPLADILYITKIDLETAGDTFFPTFDPKEYTKEIIKEVDGDIPYAFLTYRRRKALPQST